MPKLAQETRATPEEGHHKKDDAERAKKPADKVDPEIRRKEDDQKSRDGESAARDGQFPNIRRFAHGVVHDLVDLGDAQAG